MTDETDEEVRRVLDSIDSLGEVGDPTDRARRCGQLLDAWPEKHAGVRQMRQQAMQEMKDAGMSLRAIASELDISFSRVRQILEGETTSKTNKASKRRAEESQDDGAAESS